MGFYAMLLTSLRRGLTIVTLDTPVIDKIFDLIDAHKISFLVGGPPMMPAVASSGAAGKLQSLQKIYSGGTVKSSG
jgi:acyl-coenzyme A synthetase/AMP-(fatty) acid ligase